MSMEKLTVNIVSPNTSVSSFSPSSSLLATLQLLDDTTLTPPNIPQNESSRTSPILNLNKWNWLSDYPPPQYAQNISSMEFDEITKYVEKISSNINTVHDIYYHIRSSHNYTFYASIQSYLTLHGILPFDREFNLINIPSYDRSQYITSNCSPSALESLAVTNYDISLFDAALACDNIDIIEILLFFYSKEFPYLPVTYVNALLEYSSCITKTQDVLPHTHHHQHCYNIVTQVFFSSFLNHTEYSSITIQDTIVSGNINDVSSIKKENYTSTLELPDEQAAFNKRTTPLEFSLDLERYYKSYQDTYIPAPTTPTQSNTGRNDVNTDHYFSSCGQILLYLFNPQQLHTNGSTITSTQQFQRGQHTSTEQQTVHESYVQYLLNTKLTHFRKIFQHLPFLLHSYQPNENCSSLGLHKLIVPSSIRITYITPSSNPCITFQYQRHCDLLSHIITTLPRFINLQYHCFNIINLHLKSHIPLPFSHNQISRPKIALIVMFSHMALLSTDILSLYNSVLPDMAQYNTLTNNPLLLTPPDDDSHEQQIALITHTLQLILNITQDQLSFYKTKPNQLYQNLVVFIKSLLYYIFELITPLSLFGLLLVHSAEIMNFIDDISVFEKLPLPIYNKTTNFERDQNNQNRIDANTLFSPYHSYDYETLKLSVFMESGLSKSSDNVKTDTDKLNTPDQNKRKKLSITSSKTLDLNPSKYFWDDDIAIEQSPVSTIIHQQDEPPESSNNNNISETRTQQNSRPFRNITLPQYSLPFEGHEILGLLAPSILQPTRIPLSIIPGFSNFSLLLQIICQIGIPCDQLLFLLLAYLIKYQYRASKIIASAVNPNNLSVHETHMIFSMNCLQGNDGSDTQPFIYNASHDPLNNANSHNLIKFSHLSALISFLFHQMAHFALLEVNSPKMDDNSNFHSNCNHFTNLLSSVSSLTETDRAINAKSLSMVITKLLILYNDDAIMAFLHFRHIANSFILPFTTMLLNIVSQFSSRSSHPVSTTASINADKILITPPCDNNDDQDAFVPICNESADFNPTTPKHVEHDSYQFELLTAFHLLPTNSTEAISAQFNNNTAISISHKSNDTLTGLFEPYLSKRLTVEQLMEYSVNIERYLIFVYLYCKLHHYTATPLSVNAFQIDIPPLFTTHHIYYNNVKSQTSTNALGFRQFNTIKYLLSRAIQELTFFTVHSVTFDTERLFEDAPTYYAYCKYYFSNSLSEIFFQYKL